MDSVAGLPSQQRSEKEASPMEMIETQQQAASPVAVK